MMNSVVTSLWGRQQRFAQATWLRQVPPPAWSTTHRVLMDEGSWALRDFSKDEVSRPMVLVVPPEVNASTIVDFSAEQSLVGTILSHGFSRVAALCWGSADEDSRERGIDDSVMSILASLERLSSLTGHKSHHVVGVCQGGWESAIAAALQPDRFASLTLVAAPIDFHAGAGLVQGLARSLPMAVFENMVAMGEGVMRGKFISSGFDNLLPFERYFLKYLSIWNHLDDAEWMERFYELNDWYRAPKDLPGPMYLQAVRELFKDNKLIKGRMEVMGRRVELSNIRCPVALVAGSKDHITPPEQVWAAEAAVGSQKIFRRLIPAGHVGTFMGKQALADHWPAVLAKLREWEDEA
ncbi:MAG: alpha/beta hydrolase [Deltaproteobacteria bacterium]|nr:alpha/beta hydrolase [Deltaproteobacteria bacterium]